MTLLKIHQESLKSVDPAVLLRSLPIAWRQPDAALYLGKAAWRASEIIQPSRLSLGIGPHPCPPSHWTRGNHPLPGPASFEAGRKLMEFFDELRRVQARRLNVFISGGASSMLWLRPSHLSEDKLLELLGGLYRKALPIRVLNQERARLCALKSGGAAKWLARISPQTQVRVFVLSDVAPYPLGVVGSGPFWDGRIPHVLLADNRTWIKGTPIARSALLASRAAWIAPWQAHAEWLGSQISRALSQARRGDILLGGEALIRLAPGATQRGGRLTHLACVLADRFSKELEQGRLEILLASSDGKDGQSGSSATLLCKTTLRPFSSKCRDELRHALKTHSTAAWLNQRGALIPETTTGTNVQDRIIARVVD